MQEQQDYGAYTGSSRYDGPPQQPQYPTPPQNQGIPPQMDNSVFMDDLANRISQHMQNTQNVPQGTAGKIYPQGYYKNRASAGQRLALAIVSIALIVPIIGVTIGLASATSAFVGLIAFGLAAFVLIAVNFIFNQLG